MGKKYKKNKADAVHAKKSAAADNPFATARPSSAKRSNPFEMHVNREKFQILGRTCKHDKGLPGVSRGKAMQKRKETIGQEFQVKYKTNKFNDRRIGGYLKDDELTEEVINARFVADRMGQSKTASKASRFNLDDSEVLTHRGQTLEEIEQFQDDRSDDEGSNDEALDASFTEAAHFGGAPGGDVKDRQTAIEEMIIEQKRRKVELAKEKDEIHELTQKLDSNYKDLIGLMGKTTKKELKEAKTNDDYDKLMREMVFEPRGQVTDKLITEEDQAKAEKERLERLENERLRRMRADDEDDEQNQRPKHRSADDLDDGYFANGDVEEETTLAYNLDGELGTDVGGGAVNGDAEENGDELSAAEEESGDEEDSEAEEGDEEEDDDDEGDADDLSDLKDSDSEQESDDEVAQTEEKAADKSEKAEKNLPKAVKVTPTRTDLPYTIEMPGNYKEFLSLVSQHSAEDQATIVERIIKCNHPKLDPVNREVVIKLFTFLLQYINELFSDANASNIRDQFKLLSALTPHIYDLVQLNTERMSTILLNVIKEKYAEYRKNSKQFPPLETVVFFKLVSNLYSTSDFRNPLVTPCYMFTQHVLSKARIRTRQDLAIGLFMVTSVLEYSQLSKRFVPAALNFLLGIVYMSIPKRPIETMKIIPPFQSTGPMSKLLAISGESTKASEEAEEFAESLLEAEDLVTITFTPAFKVKALNSALQLIKDAMETYKENVGSNYLAMPLLEMFERLPLEVYPKYVRTNFEATKAVLEEVAAQELNKLVPPEKKPKALRLLEPRIETVYDDKRRPKVSQEREEKLKLLHRVKRETKGAIREIRRDTGFLQKMRIKQQIQSDIERKEKVKRIYQEASIQQGELNELARAKKKKKF